ncbi:SDR family NAD(P)-dependent oxidoreductase [Pigmentiphaga aceris]|uniref:SDR family NAD(P)-dependent oxidoreductase n=1 Tax=Pigmentiphaga aceris TaxID=1940612 RepID=A0A5C0B4I8_9BURK|nr:SDR family NAD(P)-dependent oxidoreductase [Pigmentiphaga aceris]QEI07741.1 SDR family NAD(P)-dependent oxidoreductase [Pigmentiphaga aceris]
MKTARFRRPRILIAGCGDTGMLLLAQLATRARVFALTSQATRQDELRKAGAIPLVGNLDSPASLRRLRGLASRVVMLAPPPTQGARDTRSAHLAAALRRPGSTRQYARRQTVSKAGSIVAKPTLHIVYGSTTGVYGNAHGRWISETEPVRPATDRAKRRVDAESQWRSPTVAQARSHLPAWQSTILRIPGIYGRDRLPLDRLRRGLPRLADSEDVYTNHIEISDLARIAATALWRGRAQRVIHANDGEELKMRDYLDAVADAAGLPRAPARSAAEVEAAVSPMMWTFMRESRRLRNTRLQQELRVKLRYPNVDSALSHWFGA